MTGDLVTFLRARLAADEQVAKAASKGWRTMPFGRASEAGIYPEALLFAALNDPARVLAEVDAKRRALTLHEAEPGQHPDFCGYDKHELPCPALRLAALPYANHEAYRDEWRP